jgi:hypothetical protein
MTFCFIACEDGIDTIALQRDHPEFFNVTDKDGVANWTLRADVHAMLAPPWRRQNTGSVQ